MPREKQIPMLSRVTRFSQLPLQLLRMQIYFFTNRFVGITFQGSKWCLKLGVIVLFIRENEFLDFNVPNTHMFDI